MWTARCGLRIDGRRRKAWHRLPLAGRRADCTCRPCADSLASAADGPSFLYDTEGPVPVEALPDTLAGFRARIGAAGTAGPRGYFTRWFVIEGGSREDAGSCATAYRSGMLDVWREHAKRARLIRILNGGLARGRKLQAAREQAEERLSALRLRCRVLWPAYVLLAEDTRRWEQASAQAIETAPDPA